MKTTWRWLVVAVLAFLGVMPLSAQDQALVSLEMDVTALETGQTYDVRIRVDDVTEAWILTVEISYDPRLLYIIGTQAGSPVQRGDFFAPADSTVIVRNTVEGGRVIFTISMLPPAEPLSGGGVAGVFRVYPLASGSARLTFSRASITAADVNDQGTSVPRPIPFQPVLLDLSISGNPVQPPSEATATPEPTETPTPGNPAGVVVTQQPTLENITAAPRTPEAATATPEAAAQGESGPSSALILAIIVMVIGGAGTLILIVIGVRRRGS